MLATMDRNRKIIETDVDTLVFYMSGGLNYNDAWLLTGSQRRSLTNVIEKHYEAASGRDKKQML